MNPPSSEGRAYFNAKVTAMNKWGDGWKNLSEEQRKGAIALSLLQTIGAQDASVSDERIGAIARHASDRIIDES